MVGYEHGVRHKLRRDICGCAALIPLLEKDKAVPLELKRSPVHLLGKHSPTVARFRRTARRPGRSWLVRVALRVGIS
jgi:hypothetical protein